MHIYISGGSGRNGKLTIQAALSRGHTVTALVRNPSSLDPHPNLTILEGTPLSQPDVERALTTPGPPAAAITTLSQRRLSNSPFAAPHPDSPPDFLATAAKTLLAAINNTVTTRANPPKLVVNSSQGASASRGSMLLPLRTVMRYGSMRREMDDHDAVEALVRGSGLRFVIAKPCLLVEGGVKEVRVWPESGKGSPWISSVTRESVASWMVDAAERAEWDGTAPVITN